MNIVYRAASLSCTSLLVIAAMSQAAPAFAADSANPMTAWEASRTNEESDMVTTGVAKGRDRLDSATSTSSIKDNEVDKLAPRSLDDLFRNIPGIRVEGGVGEGGNNYTVRGLPLVTSGAKYVQLQEDGLPVLEFGDLLPLKSDALVRADLNLASVESIRGGSASTFTSNAPGGIINLVSKTGEVEGGSVLLSAGVNYDTNRVDFDYGGHLSDTWRFHVGGFFRQGEGPRETGYNALDGGQIKFNVTKQLDGGYVRFYGKLLDDKFPSYSAGPMNVSGTNANPTFSSMPNFNAVKDTLMSRYITGVPMTDTDGNSVTNDAQAGYHVKAKTFGTEAQIGLGEWSFTERFRYSDISGHADTFTPQFQFPAAVLTSYFSPTGTGTITYASGPHAGEVVDPATVSGNGQINVTALGHTDINSMKNVTNDFRASRVWQVGGGDLTTTAGVYKAFQKVDAAYYGVNIVQDIVGDGNSALLNVTDGNGNPVFSNGIFQGDDSTNGRYRMNLDYDVLAPYASFNFHKGKVAIGGSIRYDRDKVSGSQGYVISPTGTPQAVDSNPVNYRDDYVSYSAGINYRMADSFSLFARHSLGGRADAGELSPTHDYVRQSEVGLKFRKNGIMLNLTGFYATTRGTFLPLVANEYGVNSLRLVSRSYRTYGAEFEGAVRRGPFSVTGSATVTGGKITAADATVEGRDILGNQPRRQPTLLYTLTPQFEVERVTVGANVQGQTSSYSDDINLLRMPGFTTVGLFAQYRPIDRIELGVNVSNVFDKTAIIAVNSASGALPATGIATVQTLYGRLVSASARFFF